MKTNTHLHLLLSLVILSLFASCKVEFTPNAPWREVPAVYCVIDPDEDTVWARVQRCYLGEDTLFNYSTITDSNYFHRDDITVHLLSWQATRGSNHSLTRTNKLSHRWPLSYTERPGKPDGLFPSGLQPLYYCTPGKELLADTGCVFQLVVLSNTTGDTIASAYTSLVGFLRPRISGRDTTEDVLIKPSASVAFGYLMGCRGDIVWNSLPRGRRYQPILTFYYRKNNDTLSLDITGATIVNTNQAPTLTSRSITQSRFLSAIQRHLADNTDTLRDVSKVTVTIQACNEDLNAYINSLSHNAIGGQEYQIYSNVDGGVGIFASRRSHISVTVPCDSNGANNHIPWQLLNLGVGFYGNFTPAE